jgi:tetratricopeptide (TPR) repeat protein
LIDTESGSYLWTEAYDRELQNIFTMQEEMARAIADALQIRFGAPAAAAGTRNTLSVASYNLCLQGRFHANNRTAEGLRKSIACYSQAIGADEMCAEAYSGLADAYSLQADYGLVDPTQVMPQARAAAERALAIDPNSAEAFVSLAFIRSLFDRDWASAEPLYRRAIALNPGYSRAHHWFGIDYLALLGRLDEAYDEMLIAHQLDPLSQILREGCGYVHMLRREYASALKVYWELSEMDPTFYKAYNSMGRVYQLMGSYDEAITAFKRALELGGFVPNIAAALAQTLALAKRDGEARALVKKLEEIQKERWLPATSFAVAYLGMGDHAKCLDFLEAACDRHELAVTSLKVHPMYDPLRSEPRFGRLLERIGFLP